MSVSTIDGNPMTVDCGFFEPARTLAEREPRTEDKGGNSAAYQLLCRMAADYRPLRYKRDIILEICFTDVGETWRLILGRDACRVRQAGAERYVTRIETALDVWNDIAEGRLNGPVAVMRGLLKVSGDFAVMPGMPYYFKGKEEAYEQGLIHDLTLKFLPLLGLTLLLPLCLLWP